MPVLSPPESRIDDGVVGLRSFQPHDLPAFEAAARPGGNDGIWLILNERDPRQALSDHMTGRPGRDPIDLSLAVVTVDDDAMVGSMSLIVRDGHSVEITYGVAPAHRGQGVATRAARLASDWLLDELGWPRVELRIDDKALASQRIATKAGFQWIGRIRTWVPSAGREFEDLLYVRRNDQQ